MSVIVGLGGAWEGGREVVGRGYTEFLEGVAGLDPWGIGVVEMEGLGIVWKRVNNLGND